MAGKNNPGPRKGYKQSPEHIARRIKSGEDHPNWIGDRVSHKSGRSRALRNYPAAPCLECGASPGERHHIDGNTANNHPSNIRMMCRKHHMAEHARLGTYKAIQCPRDERGRYVRSK